MQLAVLVFFFFWELNILINAEELFYKIYTDMQCFSNLSFFSRFKTEPEN